MLEIKNLSFSVEDTNRGTDGKLDILNDISLTVNDGKFIVITGPNGSGKSTLAKVIMGVNQATSGSMIFDGTDITDMPICERAKLGIGYGFQTPARFKGMTVRKLLSISAGENMASCECNKYLSMVGLCSSDILNREVDKSLSGGELKRIEIATILARNPKLAIFDEPEAGIDLWSFDRLTETFKEIHAQNKENTIVIISHQERIIDLADEIILLCDGRIEKVGPKDEMVDLIGSMSRGLVNPDCTMIPQNINVDLSSVRKGE